jgi:hypothetical protein
MQGDPELCRETQSVAGRPRVMQGDPACNCVFLSNFSGCKIHKRLECERREFGNKKKREFFVTKLLRLISDTLLLRMICVERMNSLCHTFNIYNLNLNITNLA